MADRSTSQSRGEPVLRELGEPTRREPSTGSTGGDAAPEQAAAFGALLRHYRREAGLTQEALAERAHLSARAIAALERGVNRAPRRDTLQLLAEALGLAGPARAAFEAAARWSGAARAEPRAGVVALPGGPSLVPLAGPAAPAPAVSVVPTNLPLALTSFVGRERELATVRHLLGQTRLLTLTGAGGCGKTRLALEVARALADEAHQAAASYADGIWLVELAALGDGALVPQAIAAVLGIREQPGQPLLDRLTAILRPKQMLLVLDNCEHLVAACAGLAEALLRACPHLTILATSREALGVGGEQPWRVPSLRVPDPGARLSAEEVLASEAVQLFVQRARVARPELALSDAQVGQVAQVCRRLDGIPLAIELAAARLAALPLETLAARLDDRFRLLSGGSRTALPRQQTLRATLDWSYELLGEPERLLLRRLAVFAGGWTLEAAEAVCAGEGLAPEVLEVLAGLIARSLVQLEEWEEGAAGGRYRMLETVRQYGWEKLTATGEAARVQERHLDWYVALAEQAVLGMGGAEREGWLDRLEAELENLRAALAWSSREEGRHEAGLRLAAALEDFWYMRGYAGEGRRWLEVLLAHGGVASAALRARSLEVLALLAFYQADVAPALRLFEAAYDLHSSTGNVHSATWALTHQARMAIELGNHQRATTLLERVLPAHRKRGDRHGIGWTLCYLAQIRHLQGDYARAATLFEEGLAQFEELGDKYGISDQLCHLAAVARDLGNHERATRLYRESLRVRRSLLDKPGFADCFEGLAVVAGAAGQAARAARLGGAASGLREATGWPVHVLNRAAHDRMITEVQAALGEDAYAAAWAQGRAMGLEKAIAYALQEGGAAPGDA